MNVEQVPAIRRNLLRLYGDLRLQQQKSRQIKRQMGKLARAINDQLQRDLQTRGLIMYGDTNQPGKIWIGNQANHDSLRSFVDEHGKIHPNGRPYKVRGTIRIIPQGYQVFFANAWSDIVNPPEDW